MPVERALLDGEVVRMVIAVAVIVVEIDADLMRMVAVVGMGMSEPNRRAHPGDQHGSRQQAPPTRRPFRIPRIKALPSNR